MSDKPDEDITHIEIPTEQLRDMLMKQICRDLVVEELRESISKAVTEYQSNDYTIRKTIEAEITGKVAEVTKTFLDMPETEADIHALVREYLMKEIPQVVGEALMEFVGQHFRSEASKRKDRR